MLEGISNLNSYVKDDSTAQKMAQKLSENQGKSSRLSTASSKKNNNRIAAIKRKMQQGQKLSTTDMSYLRKNAPELHQKAARIEKAREDFEQKIKNCKSKEEFDRLRTIVTQSAIDIGGIGSNAPSFDTTQGINTTTDMNISVSESLVTNTNISVIENTGTATITTTTDSNNISSDNSSSYQDENNSSTDSLGDGNVNYLYRSLDHAYRSFIQSETYRKLPITHKKNPEENKINIKV